MHLVAGTDLNKASETTFTGKTIDALFQKQIQTDLRIELRLKNG